MPTFEHGTIVAYKIHRCHCTPCTAANRRYENRRTRLIAYGQWQPFVDAEPVREHLRALSEEGLGWRRVVELTGVPRGSMRKLMYPIRGRGPTKRIRPAAAAAILAVHADLDTLAPKALVDTAGTIRRMQALACLGWSLGEQARSLGWTHGNYAGLQSKNRVTAATARAVRDLYDQWSMTPAPDGPGPHRARLFAGRKGYLPPLAWDDDFIDLPEQQLAAELARRAAEMSDVDARSCHNARHRLGDKTPLVLAGAAEYDRRKKARTSVQATQQEGSTAA